VRYFIRALFRAQVKEFEMSKKLFYSISFVLIAALALSGTAFAASGGTARQVNRVGRVTARGSSSFTLRTIGGVEYTVQVDPATQFQRVSGGALTYGNIGVNDWVTAVGTMERNRVLNADTVVEMPANLNRGHWEGKRAYGTVLQVIPGDQTFTLITGNGRMRFTVNDDTAFTGNSVRSFAALQAGMQAVVSFKQARDGSLIARSVGGY
jgi:hypothetical protein